MTLLKSAIKSIVYTYIKYIIKFIYIKIYKIYIKFDDTEIEKYKFHQNKSSISINDTGNNKIVGSSKVPFGKQDFKCFIGYKDSEKCRPLCIFRTQMVIYKRDFDGKIYIYFLTKKEKGFIKYMEISEKVRSIIKNKWKSELIFRKKYLKPEKKINTKGGF